MRPQSLHLPLESVSDLLFAVEEIGGALLSFAHDLSYCPTPKDLDAVGQMARRYHQGFAVSYHVEQVLKQRAARMNSSS